MIFRIRNSHFDLYYLYSNTNVYESVKKHDKFAYMYHVGNLFYSLKNLGTFNVIPMATIKEMQDYFGGLYD